MNFYVFWYLHQEEQGRRAGDVPAQRPSLADRLRVEAGASRCATWTFRSRWACCGRGNEYEGALTYIHKVKDGRDIYFFANSSPKAIDTKVVLRGNKALRIWNPHTGATGAGRVHPAEANGQPVTTVHLVLPSVSSLFYVGQ